MVLLKEGVLKHFLQGLLALRLLAWKQIFNEYLEDAGWMYAVFIY